MEKYRDMKIKKRSGLKMLRNLVFFIGLIIFTFWFLFKDQDLGELKDVIVLSNKWFVILASLLMLCSYLMESYNIKCVLHKLGEKKFSILRGLKYTAIGAFFSAITPASTGGQPVEVYYMSKDGIKPTNGTMSMLIELCSFQICSIFLSILCAILNPSLLSGGFIWFYILGIVINSSALIGMLFGIFSNKITKKFVNLFIKGIEKVKVKNYEKKKQKIEESLFDFFESSKYIREHKIELVKGILRVFIQVSLYHSIPYFIYRSFGLTELSFFNLFSMQAILYTTVSGIPIPGAVGVSETLFLKLYGEAFGKTLLNGAMLLFRFASFYLYIIIFLVVFLIVASKTKNKESIIDKNIDYIEEDINEENGKLVLS